LRDEFAAKLLISWIFHDSALEGDVLTYSEIKAATDRNIISDVSLIPAYEDIKAFDAAARFISDYAGQTKRPIDLDLVRQVFCILAPDEAAKGAPYRKENPLHRLYYHEIAPPEKVGYRMRKLGEWLMEDPRKDEHPIAVACGAHRQLMAIFPWPKASGRVARVLSNLILLRHDYPIAVVHSIDRQRYYEALRAEDDKLELLYLEAVATTAQSAIRVFDEARERAGRGRRRAS
jgi:Fic family protein